MHSFSFGLPLSYLLLMFNFCLLALSVSGGAQEVDQKQTFSLTKRSQIRTELGPQLSSGAVIIDADGGDLKAATKRWQEFASPNFTAAVMVTNEQDIIATVRSYPQDRELFPPGAQSKLELHISLDFPCAINTIFCSVDFYLCLSQIKYANKYSIPFLAVNAGHGEIKSLAGMKNGISISLGKMNKVSVNYDGTTANIQGGATNLDVTTVLWKAGKQTGRSTAHFANSFSLYQHLFHMTDDELYMVTAMILLMLINHTVSGTCECVGFAGPMLGGGHGFLQGYYGLVADQLVSARVVLANGTAITVSNSSNTDLYWALRGAGHNYGILSEINIKVYSVPASTSSRGSWYYENFIYSAASVEGLFDAINTAKRNSPAEFINYAVFLRSPDIDPVNVSQLVSTSRPSRS
jgi:hypothetical protein